MSHVQHNDSPVGEFIGWLMLLVAVIGIPILAFSESSGLGIFSAIVSVVMVVFTFKQSILATDYGIRDTGISAQPLNNCPSFWDHFTLTLSRLS